MEEVTRIQGQQENNPHLLLINSFLFPDMSGLVPEVSGKKMKCSIFNIFQRFSTDLGPHFRTKLAHLGTKLAIKAPLEALLGALGRLFGSKMLPKRPPEAPRPPQTAVLIDFQLIFGKDHEKNIVLFQAPELLEQCFKE